MKEMNGVFTYSGKDYNFEFKTSLYAYEKLLFVKTVVNNLVDEHGYDVVIRDLIFDFAVIDVFTNIDTSSFIHVKDDNGNDVDSIILIEHFLSETNVADVVKENVEYGLLDELDKAIDLNIHYLTGIQYNPLNEALASLASSFEEKLNGVDFDGFSNIIRKFASMSEEFTPENVVNAYIGSDAHKKNVKEIKESKKK